MLICNQVRTSPTVYRIKHTIHVTSMLSEIKLMITYILKLPGWWQTLSHQVVLSV